MFDCIVIWFPIRYFSISFYQDKQSYFRLFFWIPNDLGKLLVFGMNKEEEGRNKHKTE